jgi:glycerol-3-phosphate dehydrogenase
MRKYLQLLAEKTWAHFKAHFSAALCQHKKMQGESAATSGYHSANAAVGQTEEQMDEATIGALANLATATAADRGVVATLTEANARLVKQLEDNPNELRELKALIKKERFENLDNTVLIRQQTIIAGLMATKSPILTPV